MNIQTQARIPAEVGMIVADRVVRGAAPAGNCSEWPAIPQARGIWRGNGIGRFDVIDSARLKKSMRPWAKAGKC
jgi:hypothetical protein